MLMRLHHDLDRNGKLCGMLGAWAILWWQETGSEAAAAGWRVMMSASEAPSCT